LCRRPLLFNYVVLAPRSISEVVETAVNNWNQIEEYIFKWFSVLKASPLALDLVTNDKNSFQ